MKRLFATLLALTMALSLAACGGSKGTTPAEDTSDTQEPAAEEPTDKELSGDLVLYSSMTESDLDALDHLLQREVSRHQCGGRQRLRR